MNNNTGTVEYKPRFLEKLGFGSFSAASNIVYQFKSLYYLFFLTEVLHIPMATAGALLSLGIVWDAVNDPLVGWLAVNHRFKNGERVRPFALWCSVPWALTLLLIFAKFDASPKWTVILAGAAYFIFELLYTMIDIPYNCMGGLATNSDAGRRSINIHRNLGSCVGTAIGAVACFPLLRFFGGLDENGNLDKVTGSRGFFLTAAVMSAVCILGCLIHYFTTKERVEPQEEKEERISLFHAFKVLYSYRPFVMNTLYILLYGIINLLVLTCLTYYCTYVMGSASEVTMLEAAYLVTSLVMTLFVGLIDTKLGRKKTMVLGGLFFALGKVWFIIDPFSTAALYVNAITTGLAVSITFVMFNTNRNNLSDLIEWREGRRCDGMIGTADNLSTKIGEAIAAQLLTRTLAAAGYDSTLTEQPASAINAINAMLGWIPALVGVGIVVVVLFLNIDSEMARMKAERAAAETAAEPAAETAAEPAPECE